jgi:REP element-mobilizing transposase RayT
MLASDLSDRLWPYLGGIARENKMKALAIGGIADHVHTLVSLPATLSLAKAVQLLRGILPKWIHETFPKLLSFEWQEGYGAFSIGVSGVDKTMRYIRNQPEHHRARTFKEEFISMLPQARVRLRRVDARLILSSLPDSDRKHPANPAPKRRSIFFRLRC